MTGTAILRELAALLGDEAVGLPPPYKLADATQARALRGRAEAIAVPQTAESVRRIVGWCYAHDVPVTPRGGGTGYAGGCVPNGGVVVDLSDLNRILAFDPLLWRMHVEAGVTTHRVRHSAHEGGLMFPPDPGASEQSQLGGNIATNAGGPHAFKYGVTGHWVTGIEAVVAPGELIEIGGPVRKDVAGYDLKNLLIGSEGTLGIITKAWLRLIPRPEVALPVLAFHRDARAGQAAVEAAMASGVIPSAIEFVDEKAMEIAIPAFSGPRPRSGSFVVIVEADGRESEARAARAELADAVGEGACGVWLPETSDEIASLWRWREGIPIAVDGYLGGKISEDIGVPVEALAEAVERTRAIGRARGLEACSWGHAGDGNLHASFLFDRGDGAALRRAHSAAEDLFVAAIELGGTVSGEHGIGRVKRGQLSRQWPVAATDLHRALKATLDPKGLLNPGVKEA